MCSINCLSHWNTAALHCSFAVPKQNRFATASFVKSITVGCFSFISACICNTRRPVTVLAILPFKESIRSISGDNSRLLSFLVVCMLRITIVYGRYINLYFIFMPKNYRLRSTNRKTKLNIPVRPVSEVNHNCFIPVYLNRCRELQQHGVLTINAALFVCLLLQKVTTPKKWPASESTLGHGEPQTSRLTATSSNWPFHPLYVRSCITLQDKSSGLASDAASWCNSSKFSVAYILCDIVSASVDRNDVASIDSILPSIDRLRYPSLVETLSVAADSNAFSRWCHSCSHAGNNIVIEVIKLWRTWCTYAMLVMDSL